MSDAPEDWKPGSFTKNFSWGPLTGGLVRLHECIRLGFNSQMADVPRTDFRERLAGVNRPDFIPINFFMFNRRIENVDYIVADELVFQAINFEHSARFDKLALFAFNFSYAGKFTGARAGQRRPALWAYHYIKDHVATQLEWDTSKVTADDIEAFLRDSPNYKGQPSRRKAATNLAYLYQLGRLSELRDGRIDRWWVDSLFLALDRLIDDRKLDGMETHDSQLAALLRKSGFSELTGKLSLERQLGIEHLIRLYGACGGRERFSEDYVKSLSQATLSDFDLPNDDRPQGAVHPTNARILKSIPRICAMLAKYAGFDIIDTEELLNFDLEDFVRRQTREALRRLRDQKIEPTMTGSELMRLTREK
jgi:hypothetical protein